MEFLKTFLYLTLMGAAALWKHGNAEKSESWTSFEITEPPSCTYSVHELDNLLSLLNISSSYLSDIALRNRRPRKEAPTRNFLSSSVTSHRSSKCHNYINSLEIRVANLTAEAVALSSQSIGTVTNSEKLNFLLGENEKMQKRLQNMIREQKQEIGNFESRYNDMIMAYEVKLSQAKDQLKTNTANADARYNRAVDEHKKQMHRLSEWYGTSTTTTKAPEITVDLFPLKVFGTGLGYNPKKGFHPCIGGVCFPG